MPWKKRFKKRWPVIPSTAVLAILTIQRDSSHHEGQEILAHLIFLALFAVLILFAPFRLRNWDE